MDLVVRHSLPALAALEIVGVVDYLEALEVYEAMPGFGKAKSVTALPGDFVVVLRLRPECRPGPVHYLPDHHVRPPCAVSFDLETSAWTGVRSRGTCADCMRSRKFLADSGSHAGVSLKQAYRTRADRRGVLEQDVELADHEALVSAAEE
jgi:hypothetical protein